MKPPTAALSITPHAARPLPVRPLLAAGGLAIAVGWIALSGAIQPHLPRLGLLAAAPALIQLHVAAAVVALGIGTALLIGVKGTGVHKALGWTWVLAMGAVAVSSLFITETHPGRFSLIHLFSGWTIIALPMGIAAIKRRKVQIHRRTMTGLFVGGLIVAGAFTFVPGRLMWRVFLG